MLSWLNLDRVENCILDVHSGLIAFYFDSLCAVVFSVDCDDDVVYGIICENQTGDILLARCDRMDTDSAARQKQECSQNHSER